VSTIAALVSAEPGSAPGLASEVRAVLAATSPGGQDAGVTTWSNGRVTLGRSGDGVDRNGAQPHVDAVTGNAIVLEGRIDNLDELREALDRGDRPLAPPVETVLAAYSRWGEDAAARLLGDFAFAIWDGAAARLVCGRDALGQRPLFYAVRPRVTIVASDSRQVVSHPDVPAAPNEGMLAEFLSGVPNTDDETVWAGVFRLCQGHLLVVDQAGSRTRRYWDFDLGAELRYRRQEEYDEHFRELFARAVRCCIGDERAVGVFLSGGIDSSSIAGMAASGRDAGGPSVHAFSLAFPGHRCDERRFVDDTVRRWTVPLERLTYAAATRADFEWEVDRFHEMPSEPTGAILHPLRRRVREAGLRVVLTGFGGDEWFTGSLSHTADLLGSGNLFGALRQLRHDAALPGRGYSYLGLARNAVGQLLPSSTRRVLGRLLGSRPRRLDWINPLFAARVGLADRLQPKPLPPASSRSRRDTYWTANNVQRTFADEREHRAARAAGIDQRHPFYDRRLAEFGLALPEPELWHLGVTKVIVRRALDGMLVDSVKRRNDKAEFSTAYAGAIAAAGGRRAFERLRSVEAGWVDGRVALQMHDDMIRLYSAGDDAYIPLADVLCTILGIELWLQRAHPKDGHDAHYAI
jgi:asparagine synthase (glutamine-hydrolysing)